MNTHDLPVGITVEIARTNDEGLVRETFDQYGRSVHFAHGTPYFITITNTTNKHASLKLTVDGKPASITPILLYKAGHRKGRRNIKGFDLTRETVELENDEFEMTSTYTPFIATRPSRGVSALATDSRIGTIRFEFFATRYTNRQPGRKQKLTAMNHNPQMLHNTGPARVGVLGTEGGGIETKGGKHFKGEEESGRRPIADLTKLLDPAIPSYEITICEVA